MRSLFLIPDPLIKNQTILLFILNLFFIPTYLFSAATWTDNVSASGLASQIQGNGITITNPTLRRGSGKQVGTFSNGIAGSDLEIDEGILLTCMSVEESFTSNNSGTRSINNTDITPDSDLLAIDNRARFDTVVFEFDVTLDENTRLLLIDYQFASDEYNEYVGSIYNDAFGFFISGGDLNQTYNIARVVDDETYVTIDTIDTFPPVTVNNVNNGQRGNQDSGQPADLSNASYFIDNCLQDGTTCDFANVPLDLEYDGITHQLHATLDNLTPGETYHFKMALADTGDSQWDTGVFVSKIVGIRTPDICYDYSYKQNSRFFTEQYIEANGPHISGAVFVGSPIEVTLYIKNKEESEIKATNVKLSITDINTSQATYITDSTYLVNSNTYNKIHIPDGTNGMTATTSSISDIPVGDFDSQDYFYTYYSIDPLVHSLDIPINAMMSYDMIYPITSTQNLVISKTSFIDKDTPICSDSNFKYDPNPGSFNVEHADLFASQKYNLPTQVVKRADNFKVVSYDVNATTHNIHQRKDINTTVAVELIDAGAFHDINASCNEPSSSISPRVWVTINSSNNTDFNKTVLDSAIAQALVSDQILNLPNPITTAEEFYAHARENTAFRISYTYMDDNGSVIELIPTTIGHGPNAGPGWNVKNFTEAIKYNDGNCATDVDNNPTNVDKIPQFCNNAGKAGASAMTASELAVCMECIYGLKMDYVCSRDNFALRPESFNIKIDDQNQTDPAPTLRIADDRTGVTGTPNPARVDIAAGYNYLIDINATDHSGGGPTPGYVQGYSKTNISDHNLTLIWEPTNAVTCNDINSTPQEFNIINGQADFNLSHPQVGEYRLSMIDTDWTKVDHDSNFMTHQSDATYFYTGKDCLTDVSDVDEVGSNTIGHNVNDLTNVNGCNIDSNHDHNNSSIPLALKYRDYNLTIHPYKFLLNNLQISHGASRNTTFGVAPNETYVYMSSFDNDNNMSLNSIGTISAAGYDDTILSNYVNNCYAEDVNISLELNNTLPVCNVDLFGYHFINLDINNNPITDINRHFSDDSLTSPIITLNEGNFTKELNGTMNVVINYNYDKNATSLRLNPKRLELDGFKIGCNDINQCMINADQTLYDYNGSIDSIGAINFVQGRVHAPRYRIEGNDGNLTFYYEIYWDGNATCNLNDLFPTLPPLSVDSINWYRNTRHTTNDGNITSILKHTGSQSTVMSTKVDFKRENLHYYETKGYPYKTIMDINASPWLIYNRFNTNATVNPFDVEFNQKGALSGNGANSTNDAAEVNSNRRIMW